MILVSCLFGHSYTFNIFNVFESSILDSILDSNESSYEI